MLKRDISFLDVPKSQGPTDVGMVSVVYTSLFNTSLLATVTMKVSEMDDAVTVDRRFTDADRDALLSIVQAWSVLQLWADAERKVSPCNDRSQTKLCVSFLLF